MLDQLIAWAALLFSGIALFVSLRTQSKQRDLIDKQILEHDRISRQRREARLTVAMRKEDSWAGSGTVDRVLITNSGPAEARNIMLRFLDGKDPLPENERTGKLPIPVLGPEGHFQLTAALSFGCHPPFSVILSWEDGTGAHSQETTLA